jgi:hypothetical protein
MLYTYITHITHELLMSYMSIYTHELLIIITQTQLKLNLSNS